MKYTNSEIRIALKFMESEYEADKECSTIGWKLCQEISIACMKHCLENSRGKQ